MKYKIIDNLLSRDELLEIQKHMLGPWIPWAYNSFTVKADDPVQDTLNNYQFTHTFYRNFQITSDYLKLLDPILEKINPSALVRIKANLIPCTEKIIEHEYHYDHEHYNGKVAVFYVNTNNGYTILDDGSKIESIENRLLIFDGNVFHSGSTCTDQKVRCLINFMFYPWTNATL